MLCLLAALCLGAPLHAAGNSKETGSADSTATVELKGLLVPLDQANLSSRSTGVIRDMKKGGRHGQEGRHVVGLDDDNEKLAVESAKAVLDVRQFEAGIHARLAEKGQRQRGGCPYGRNQPHDGGNPTQTGGSRAGKEVGSLPVRWCGDTATPLNRARRRITFCRCCRWRIYRRSIWKPTSRQPPARRADRPTRRSIGARPAGAEIRGHD